MGSIDAEWLMPEPDIEAAGGAAALVGTQNLAAEARVARCARHRGQREAKLCAEFRVDGLGKVSSQQLRGELASELPVTDHLLVDPIRHSAPHTGAERADQRLLRSGPSRHVLPTGNLPEPVRL